MIILSVACDNLYMFKNFSIDFAYDGGNEKYSICKHDALFPNSKIFVRKRLILLGANASGKTTFGELLCGIDNFILGRGIEPNDEVNLYRALYDKNKEGYFKVDFVLPKSEVFQIPDTDKWGYNAYRLYCAFGKKGIRKEWIKRVDVDSDDTIVTLQKKLAQAEKIGNEIYLEKINFAEQPFVSTLITNPQYVEKFPAIAKRVGIGFHYSFSQFANESQTTKLKLTKTLVNKFDKILPVIDNSIKGVDGLITSKEKKFTNTYVIEFKNGEQLSIRNNDLQQTDRTRLSHGTFEVLGFLNLLEDISHRLHDTFYIDEKMAHLHSELEAYLVMRLFNMDSEAQLFVTSHTTDLLDLNVPTSTFLLFKRNEDQSTSVEFMDKVLDKDEPNVRAYYEDDYFGVLPDYSVLDQFFDKQKDGHHDEEK